MSDKITFYTNPMSRGRMVHWMLEEVGAPYDLKLLDFKKAEHKTPEFLAVNPMGKLPTIVHRNTVITETPAIITYLADAFPKANLAPAVDDPQRGTYLRWLFFGAGCVEPALMDKMSPRQDPGAAMSVGYGTYDDTLNALEKALTPGPFILGGRFSAADVYVGSQIGCGMMIKAIEPRPIFTSYVGRLSERPAWKRFGAQSEELAAKLKG